MRKPTSWARSESGRPRTRLDPVEQKVTAIEQRDRKQIEQPDRDRKHRSEMKERDEAAASPPARTFARCGSGRRAGRPPRGRRSRRRCSSASGRPRTRFPRRPARRPAADGTGCSLRSRGAIERLMPRMPMRWTLPKVSLTSLSAGVALRTSVAAVAFDRDVEGLAGAGADDALHVGEAFDRTAVDGYDQVARLESRRGGGAVGLHRIDPGTHRLLAVEHEDPGKNHDRQNEIRQRPGDDDGRALAHGLEHEACRRARPRPCRRDARCSGTLAALSSPKNLTKPPSGIAEIFQRVPCRSLKPTISGPNPIENTRTRTPHQRADQEMAELVEEDHEAQNEQKGNDVANNATAKRMQMRQNIATP